MESLGLGLLEFLNRASGRNGYGNEPQDRSARLGEQRGAQIRAKRDSNINLAAQRGEDRLRATKNIGQLAPYDREAVTQGMTLDPRAVQAMNLRNANQQYGDVLIPQFSQEDLIRQLTMRRQPLYKKYEDGAQMMAGQFRPAFDSIDDFTGPRY